MSKFLSAIVLSMMPLWAFAASKEIESGAPAAAEMVDVMYVVIFGIAFIGMIVGFFVYLWWVEKKRKAAGK